MIVLFTDFGEVGPYVGQVKAVLMREAPGIPVIDLLHDAPMYRSCASSYLLASLIDIFPTNAVFLCVVDPGVGGNRAPLVVEADGKYFVGPDNGLFEVILRRAKQKSVRAITWEPENLSATFHGRDLFSPVAAQLAKGDPVPSKVLPVGSARRLHWPDDLKEIIYLDNFGNAMTGVRAKTIPTDAQILVRNHRLAQSRTFSDNPEGTAFWYENSSGLIEFAVNKGDAASKLGIEIGTTFKICTAASVK